MIKLIVMDDLYADIKKVAITRHVNMIRRLYENHMQLLGIILSLPASNAKSDLLDIFIQIQESTVGVVESYDNILNQQHEHSGIF